MVEDEHVGTNVGGSGRCKVILQGQIESALGHQQLCNTLCQYSPPRASKCMQSCRFMRESRSLSEREEASEDPLLEGTREFRQSFRRFNARPRMNDGNLFGHCNILSKLMFDLFLLV